MKVLGMISRIAKDTRWVFHILFSMLIRKVLRSKIRCGIVRFVERMSPYALHILLFNNLCNVGPKCQEHSQGTLDRANLWYAMSFSLVHEHVWRGHCVLFCFWIEPCLVKTTLRFHSCTIWPFEISHSWLTCALVCKRTPKTYLAPVKPNHEGPCTPAT